MDFDTRLELVPDHVWNDRVIRERENFRAAVEWTLRDRGDVVLGQRLVASRTATWSAIASGEIRIWMSEALALSSDDIQPELAAQLAIAAARTAVIFGKSWQPDSDPESRISSCRNALRLQRPDDNRAVATAQFWLGASIQDGTI